VAYLLLRRYGGPGSETLAAGLAVFGMANVPFIYVSVNVWRTIHPKTTVVPTLPVSMGGPLWFSFGAFVLLYVALLTARMRLEEQRSRLEQLYLDLEE
jgi:heme exporter protein C